VGGMLRVPSPTARPARHAPATWNVNSRRSRLSRSGLAWSGQRPDVPLPSGNQGRGPCCSREAFEARLQRCHQRSEGYNGVAILSHTPPGDVKVGFGALLPGDGAPDP